MAVYKEMPKAGAGTIGAYDRGNRVTGSASQLQSRQSGNGPGAVDDGFLERMALTKAAQAEQHATWTPEQLAQAEQQTKSVFDQHAQSLADMREHQSVQSGFGLDDFIGGTVALFAMAAGAAYAFGAGAAAEGGAAAGGAVGGAGGAGGAAGTAAAGAIEGGATALAGGAGAIPAAVNTVTVVGQAAGGLTALEGMAAVGAGLAGAGAIASTAGGASSAVTPENTVEVKGQRPTADPITAEQLAPIATPPIIESLYNYGDQVAEQPAEQTPIPAAENTVQVVGQRPPLTVPPVQTIGLPDLMPIPNFPHPDIPSFDYTPTENVVTTVGQRPTVAPPLPMQDIGMGHIPLPSIPIIDIPMPQPIVQPPTTGNGTTSPVVTSPGGTNVNIPGLGNLWDLIKPLIPLIAANRDRITNEQDSAFWKDQMDRVTGFYKPGTPEAELMRKKIEAKDAAAGRNSQYGVREMDLAGMLAQQRANVMTSPGYLHMADAYRGHYSNSLDSIFNSLAGFQTSPAGQPSTGSTGGGITTGNSYSGGLSGLLDWVFKQVGGGGGPSTTPPPMPSPSAPAPAAAPSAPPSIQGPAPSPLNPNEPTAVPTQAPTPAPVLPQPTLQNVVQPTQAPTQAPATSLGGSPMNTVPQAPQTPIPFASTPAPTPFYQKPSPTLADIAAYGQEAGGDAYAFIKGVNDYDSKKWMADWFMKDFGFDYDKAWGATGNTEQYWKEAQRQFDAGLKPTESSMKLWKPT